MNLLPQDVFIMIALAISRSERWTYEELAHDLGMSASMVHSAVKRAEQARLYDPRRKRPRRAALEEFLIHGVKYAYPPDLGTITRGVPTAFAALDGSLSLAGSDPYVWPHPEGTVRGIELAPLYRSIPDAVRCNKTLHRALALVDVLRVGGARERKLAENELREMLAHGARENVADPACV